MLELRGKYNTAKVFTNNVESPAISQLTTLLNQEFVRDSQIRIMPDCHSGSGCVIGTTMTLKDKVVPNLVGVDIGCFSGDTKVFTSSGWVEIKDLVNKDAFTIESYDTETKSFVTSKAIAKKTRENASLVKVVYHIVSTLKEKQFEVYCTPDHKFLIREDNDKESWIEASKLSCDVELVSEDYKILVDNVYSTDRVEDVYCLTVEDTHTFLIEGSVVVHNCGMLAIKLKEKRIDLPNLDSVIRKYVPSGADINEFTNEDRTSLRVDDLRCFGKAKIRPDFAYASVGTLGGGNHFIEVDRDDNDDLWLVIHTGSRHLGIEVCNYYQELGYQKLKDKANGGARKDKLNALITQLKAEGRYREISGEIEKFNKNYREQNPSVSRELAYVEGDDFKDYIHDMDMVQRHAVCNRAEIARVIMKYANLHEVERFETVHNYIDTENMILRKGSVSAQAGEKLIIPMNMRDGSLICIGKGNPDWNYSAPHGAGRFMSRSKAKENVSMEDFKRTMEEAGIYSTSVNRSTLDESPMAYKPMEEIIENIKDTVDIVNIIKPIYNFKAAEIEKDLSKDFSITGELQKEDEYDFDR